MRAMQRSILVGLVVLAVLMLGSAAKSQPFASQIQVAINQLTTGVVPFSILRIAANGYINFGGTSGTNGYGLRDNAGTIEVKDSTGTWASIPTGSSPTGASYWTREVESSLTNESALGLLATGIVLNTTTTGVPTIYGGTTCTNQFPRALDPSGAASCESVSLTNDVVNTLPVANGGTSLSSGTSGGVLGFTAAGTLASSAALTANAIVLGGGAGATPTVLGSLGTTITVLHGNAAGAPTFGAVALATEVTGTLSASNGGTSNNFFAVAGPAASTKTYTFPNSSSTILTDAAAVTAAQGGTGQTSYTTGDIPYASAATTISKLADAATGNAIISGGVGVAPAYGKIGLTTHVSGTLGPTNGGTGFASYTTGDLLYANSGTTLARLNAVALGQVLISQGAATAPVWSAAVRVSSLNVGANLSLSSTSPTISSGFGTGSSVTGTAVSFRVDVGTGGTANQGVIGMPTAATGWNCHVEDITQSNANDADLRTMQIASSTTTVTVENQTVSTGMATAWTASDVLSLLCAAY